MTQLSSTDRLLAAIYRRLLPWSVRFSFAIYWRVARLYPPQYWKRFGVEQMITFIQLCIDAHRRGGNLAVARVFVAEIADLFSSIGKERAATPRLLPLRFFVLELLLTPLMFVTIDQGVSSAISGTNSLVFTGLMIVLAVGHWYSLILLIRSGRFDAAAREDG